MSDSRHDPIARRLLQIGVVMGSLVPIFVGLAGVFLGPGMLSDHFAATGDTLDSHYRYLSGLLVGIGVGFLTCTPDIEYKTSRFRLLTTIVFLGGLGRLYSLVMIGMPGGGMLFGLGMELIVTPLLACGQWYIARCAARRS